MKQKDKLDMYQHCVMCFTGGFLGGYALLNRLDVFGSAQTANLITIIFNIIGHNGKELCVRLGALFLYIIAMLITVFLAYRTKVNQQKYAILVNAIGFLGLAFIPKDLNPVVALYPIFFMTATQWCIFHGAKGYTCSTIFSTNNIKQTVISFAAYFYNRKKADWEKGMFFLTSLICYHTGVAISYLGCQFLGIKASFLCELAIAASFYLVHKERLLEKDCEFRLAVTESNK